MIDNGISILIPTYKRPHWMHRIAISVNKCSKIPDKVEIVFGIHQDDEESINKIEELKNSCKINIRGEIIDKYSDGLPHLAFFWNQLYKKAKYDIVGYFGDDVIFHTEGWDVEIFNEFEKDKIILVFCNDFHFKKGVATLFFTHKIIHEAVGFYLPEQFRRWYTDTYWDYVFNLIGKKKYREDIITEHPHPDKFPELADNTYKTMDSFKNSDWIIWRDQKTQQDIRDKAEILRKL